jgi:hypothetical protein
MEHVLSASNQADPPVPIPKQNSLLILDIKAPAAGVLGSSKIKRNISVRARDHERILQILRFADRSAYFELLLVRLFVCGREGILNVSAILGGEKSFYLRRFVGPLNQMHLLCYYAAAEG